MNGRLNITVPLLEDEYDHLETLVEATGLKRYQIMRQALLSYVPGDIVLGEKKSQEAREAKQRFDLETAIEVAEGNITLVCSLLGTSRSAVYGRIRKFGLQVNRKVGRPTTAQLERVRKKLHEHRNLRLLGREQPEGSGARAPGGREPAPR